MGIPLKRPNEAREWPIGAAWDVHAAGATMGEVCAVQAELPPAWSWRLSEEGHVTRSSEVRGQPYMKDPAKTHDSEAYFDDYPFQCGRYLGEKRERRAVS